MALLGLRFGDFGRSRKTGFKWSEKLSWLKPKKSVQVKLGQSSVKYWSTLGQENNIPITPYPLYKTRQG